MYLTQSVMRENGSDSTVMSGSLRRHGTFYNAVITSSKRILLPAIYFDFTLRISVEVSSSVFATL